MSLITLPPAHRAESVRNVGVRYLRVLILLFCISVLFISSGRSAQVTLAWKENTEPNVAGYRIFYGIGSRAYNWFVDVGNITQYTITGLADESTYYFAATAYNTSNVESAYSAEVIWSESNEGLSEATVDPLVINEVTLGTQFTITGSGFGTKKGKVFIGVARIKILSWDDTSIVCRATKVPLPSGPYDMIVKLQPYLSVSPSILPGALTVMNPEIDSLSSANEYPGNEVTITGRFFGTKKGKVYLENPDTGKKKNCKVTTWGMDSITFVIPKPSKSFPKGAYPLKVDNKIGIVEAPSDFTID